MSNNTCSKCLLPKDPDCEICNGYCVELVEILKSEDSESEDDKL